MLRRQRLQPLQHCGAAAGALPAGRLGWPAHGVGSAPSKETTQCVTTEAMGVDYHVCPSPSRTAGRHLGAEQRCRQARHAGACAQLQHARTPQEIWAPQPAISPVLPKNRIAEVVSACAQLRQAFLNAFTASEMLTSPRTTLKRSAGPTQEQQHSAWHLSCSGEPGTQRAQCHTPTRRLPAQHRRLRARERHA